MTPATTGNPGLSLSTWQTTYNFASPLQYQSNELGGLLHIQGGTPFVYDGATTYEDNFFYYPEFTNVTTTGTGTPLDTGSYTYAVVYVYADSAGLVHQERALLHQHGDRDQRRRLSTAVTPDVEHVARIE